MLLASCDDAGELAACDSRALAFRTFDNEGEPPTDEQVAEVDAALAELERQGRIERRLEGRAWRITQYQSFGRRAPATTEDDDDDDDAPDLDDDDE